jgi:signal transduction histidine kinase
MGLKLPQRAAMLPKGLYTLMDLGLIIIAVEVGGIRLVPLLFVVFVMRNALLLEQRGRHGVAVIAFILFAVFQYRRLRLISSILPPAIIERIQPAVFSLVLLLGLIMLFLHLLMDAWLSDYHSRRQLEAANTQLRQYALRIEDIATLQERNRIARDIHDALGHSLTTLNLTLQAALKLWVINAAETHGLVKEAQQLSVKALEDVRQSVATLRAEPLRGQSLEKAIALLVESFQKTTGITPTVNLHVSQPLSKEISLTMYRIVQEALTNIAKHAAANAVDISLTALADQALTLQIQDNGNGFEPIQNTTGFGLQGMQERTVALGGKLKITSAQGQGCQIQAIVPLALEHSTP